MTRSIRRCGGPAALLLALAAPAAAQTASPHAEPAVQGRILRLDPRLDLLVPPGAVLETVAAGHEWVEGPLWSRAGGYLLFSDIPKNAIFKWEPGKGVRLFQQPSGYTGSAPFTGREPGSNGLTFDAQGRLVQAEHGDRRIARVEPDGRKVTLVDRFEGKRINSPNDVVVLANGDLAFTDPPFGLPGSFDDPGKELAFQGVYRVTPGSAPRLLTKTVRAPNGIGFGPGERTLVVSNADRARPVWLVFDVTADGGLANERVLFDGTPWLDKGPGVPDGLKLDLAGNVFGAGPGGVYVIAPDGTLLGIIETGVATSNVAWGGDGSDLYVTASTAVFKIRLATRGRVP